MTEHPAPGRRALNKADKERRIRAAARELFFSRGFSAVTTQEVADRAGVGTGTLFRYASSKGEMLCMAVNEEFTQIAGKVPVTGDPDEDLLALCDPLIAGLRNHPENVVAYHRETLFGESGPHRAEALRILRELRGIVARILAAHTAHKPDDRTLDAPARTVFDVIYMEVVRAAVDAQRGTDQRTGAARDHRTDLAGHIHRVLHGVLPTLAGA